MITLSGRGDPFIIPCKHVKSSSSLQYKLISLGGETDGERHMVTQDLRKMNNNQMDIVSSWSRNPHKLIIKNDRMNRDG